MPIRSICFFLGTSLLTSIASQAGFEVKNHGGKIEIWDHGKVILGWQHQALTQPVGGEKFAGSAFLHPLRTPSGFDLTRIQPGDHKHHFGVWWPWKLITVDGKKYNTWEIQQGQGRHQAISVEVTSQSDDEVVLALVNQSDIKLKSGDYSPVLKEQTTLHLRRQDKQTYVIDITINQLPIAQQKVEIAKYRYSGFSWRGTGFWNKTNSQMLTSGGQNRDTANGQPARWALVRGDTSAKTPQGKATMLILSEASKNNGKPELLRVWDSKAHNGAPFINFNPVMKSTQALDAAHPGVSQRKYRLVITDHAITTEEANQYWLKW